MKKPVEPEPEVLVPELPVNWLMAEEVVRVIRNGLHHHLYVAPSTRRMLLEWCDRVEEKMSGRTQQ